MHRRQSNNSCIVIWQKGNMFAQAQRRSISCISINQILNGAPGIMKHKKKQAEHFGMEKQSVAAEAFIHN